MRYVRDYGVSGVQDGEDNDVEEAYFLELHAGDSEILKLGEIDLRTSPSYRFHGSGKWAQRVEALLRAPLEALGDHIDLVYGLGVVPDSRRGSELCAVRFRHTVALALKDHRVGSGKG